MTSCSLAQAVGRMAGKRAFGEPLVLNVWRGLVAEAIVAMAIEPEWEWKSQDYAGWDFARGGIRLEVKQSAERQPWTKESAGPSARRCNFDIRVRTGHYETGSTWIAGVRRWAHLYVFAHHGIVDDTADHREPAQWAFYVLPTIALPPTDTIPLSRLRALAEATSFEHLAARVNTVADFCARSELD